VAIAWSARQRLRRIRSRLQRRGKRTTLIDVAVGRELAGFSWSIPHDLHLAFEQRHLWRSRLIRSQPV